MDSNEPAATRYTLPPYPGYKISGFGIGLHHWLGLERARRGAPVTLASVARKAKITTETLRRLLYDTGTFERSTLDRIAVVAGEGRWEDLAVVGKRVALLGDGDA